MTATVPLQDLRPEEVAHLRTVGAEVSNLYRALGNHPPLLRAWVDFAWTLRREATTPRALRELVILRCAQLADSAYQWADHVVMARAAGVDDARIESLAQWRSADAFEPVERDVLALTDEVVAGRVSDEVLEGVRARFSDAEVVELVMTASFYVMVPRVLDALRVPHGGTTS